jgi:hypothetical protein
MPKRTASNKGFPRKPEDCFTNRHLKAAHYQVYDVMYACAFSWRKQREGDNAKGPLIFNASIRPWLCNATVLSENYVRKVVDELVKLGWLKKVNDKPIFNQDGEQNPNVYEVLTHDQFVATHPRSCPDNIFAPDFKTAEAYGVKYGQKLTTGRLPENFWPAADTALGRGIRKIAGDETALITDDELDAVHKHLNSIAGPTRAVTVPIPQGQDREDDADTTRAVMDRHHKSVDAGTTLVLEPSPQRWGVSLTATGKETVHTPTRAQAEPIAEKPVAAKTVGPGGVSVDKKTTNEMELENEIVLLLQGFLKHNNGEPAQVTKSQRLELKALLKHNGREKFRAAARAWLKVQPWDARTTHPFAGFIGGFEGYAAKKIYDEQMTVKRNESSFEEKRLSEFYSRKAMLNWLNQDFSKR